MIMPMATNSLHGLSWGCSGTPPISFTALKVILPLRPLGYKEFPKSIQFAGQGVARAECAQPSQ